MCTRNELYNHTKNPLSPRFDFCRKNVLIMIKKKTYLLKFDQYFREKAIQSNMWANISVTNAKNNDLAINVVTKRNYIKII